MADSDTTLIIFKVVSGLLLWLTAVGGAYIPKFLKSKGASPRAMAMLSLGNMLSAGVMISAGLVHLLGDVLDEVGDVGGYPLGPFLAGCGYLITLVADQVVEALYSGPTGCHHTPSPPVQHSYSQDSRESSEGGNGVLVVEMAADIGEALAAEQESSCYSRRDGGSSSSGGLASMAVGIEVNGRSHSNDGILPGGSSPLQQGGPAPADKDPAAGKQVNMLTGILLACALSVHSLLEGGALGAQETIREAQNIMIAIIAHKGLAAYALGSSLLDSKPTNRKYWTTIMFFSVATPLGMFIGYALSTFSTGVASGSLSSLAAGTFLYVAMMEVIPKELANPPMKLAKVGIMLFGFGVMSMLAIWA